MKQRLAFPYLTPSPEAIDADPWMFSLNNCVPGPLGPVLPNWDYEASLVVSRRIRFDHRILSGDVGLPTDADVLSIQVEAGTGQGTLARKIIESFRHELSRSEPVLELQIPLPSSRLSSRLSLTTTLFLSRKFDAGSRLSPRQAASRLWGDRHIVALDGDETLFPMEAISFDEYFGSRIQSGALWHLHWDPHHLNRDFRGAIRLYLNADNLEFMTRIRDQDPVMLQALLSDVIFQMCSHALIDEEAHVFLHEAEPGTVAHQISGWLKTAFGQMPAARLRSTLEARPGEFRTAILAISRV
jgi:hypothetical protein